MPACHVRCITINWIVSCRCKRMWCAYHFNLRRNRASEMPTMPEFINENQSCNVVWFFGVQWVLSLSQRWRNSFLRISALLLTINWAQHITAASKLIPAWFNSRRSKNERIKEKKSILEFARINQLYSEQALSHWT